MIGVRELTERVLEAGKDGVQSVYGGGVRFTHQPLGTKIDASGLRGYYCDFRHKAEWALRHGDGFPRVGGTGDPARWVIPVAQTALGHWELMLDGHATRPHFLRLADWLVENAEPTGQDGLLWPSPNASRKYGLPAGWGSAMGQGEAMSVLLRAHSLTDREHYRAAAKAALEPLLRTVPEGGLARRLDGALVLEEYPTAAPCAVLNGWAFAIFGVHELAVNTGDGDAYALRDDSMSGLIDLLPRYDVGWWSRYSLFEYGRPDLAKPFYQRLHVVLLAALALVRPDPVLTGTARRWQAQLTGWAVGRATMDKLVFRAYRGLNGRRR